MFSVNHDSVVDIIQLKLGGTNRKRNKENSLRQKIKYPALRSKFFKQTVQRLKKTNKTARY